MPTPQNDQTHSDNWLAKVDKVSVFDYFVGLALNSVKALTQLFYHLYLRIVAVKTVASSLTSVNGLSYVLKVKYQDKVSFLRH